MASPDQREKRLFAVYLGGRAARCNTELHDVVFVAGESIQACYHRIMDKWFGDPLRLHIDAWVELRTVDGYRISLRPQQPAQVDKLYFINLGAYLPGQFTEVHANAFMVAASEAEVRKRAKSELLLGAQSVHMDDLYEVDDCLEVREVDGQHVHLEPNAEQAPFDPHTGYHVIPPEFVLAYAQRAGN